MWKSFTDLFVALKKGKMTSPHAYNSIPSSFQRKFDHYQAQGWRFTNMHRRGQANEPIYTGHLFDRVLGGGNHFYNTLTGNMFENLNMPKLESEGASNKE